ncbi:MAG: hypothetical protein ABL985_06390 [Casimicrobium sp.]
MNYEQFWDGLPGLLILITCLVLARLIWKIGSFVGELARSRELANDQLELAADSAKEERPTADSSLPKSAL